MNQEWLFLMLLQFGSKYLISITLAECAGLVFGGFIGSWPIVGWTLPALREIFPLGPVEIILLLSTVGCRPIQDDPLYVRDYIESRIGYRPI
jgi:hypothetical protein